MKIHFYAFQRIRNDNELHNVNFNQFKHNLLTFDKEMIQASNYLYILYGGVSILHFESSKKDDMIRKQSSFYIFGYPR